MSWVNTLLDTASLGVNIANAGKLAQLREQGATAGMVEAIVKELRNQIFNYKQKADHILEREGELPPKIIAGMMKLLETRLNESGIAPDWFPELSDKEYAATTFRLIHDNSERLFSQILSSEQAEVDQMIIAVNELPDYSYYLEHFKDGQELAEVAQIRDELASRNGCLMQGGWVLMIYPGIGIPILFCGVPFGDSFFAYIGAIIGIGLWVTLIVYARRWMNTDEHGKAKKRAKELEDKVDLARFKQLNQKFGDDIDTISELHSKAEEAVQTFFGDTQLLDDEM